MGVTVDEAAIVAVVKAVEAKTSGQIVCALASQSTDAGAASALYAATLALLIPWPLLAATQMPAQRIFAVQLGVFLVALLLLGWTRLGVLLVSRHEQRRQAFRVAIEQFHIRGLARTHSRAGVLIFVSLAERYARIIADEGLSGKISEEEWRLVMDSMTGHLRDGRLTEAFVGAIEASGVLLARAAPPDGAGNELPDGLVRLD